MDLLVITWNYPPRRGGIESLVGNLCGGLRNKHLVLVVTSPARAKESFERDSYRAPYPGLICFALYALWRGTSLLLRNPNVRVVFGGSALVTPLVLMLARLFGRRSVIQTHGLDIIYRNLIYQQLCVRWLKYCDRVVANSTYTARLLEAKGVQRDRVSVIPPGVRAERFSCQTDVDANKRARNVQDRKVILFVGRLVKRKGVKEFIENSFVKIVQKIPEACFLIVGDTPTESLTQGDNVASEIKAAVSKLELKNHARLLGSLSDGEVIAWYQACDLVVLPALNLSDDVEGFGIVALEAAAAGKPVVATRVGGISDAVEDGKSGILVVPGDYRMLTEAIIDLLIRHQRRLDMGEYGRERAWQEFSWELITDRYDQLFVSL
jgi:phosphatidylinositol alpha-1,6-mannosyltransferase